MRWFLTAAVQIAVTTLLFFIVADGVCWVLLRFHQKGYLAPGSVEVPDAYFTAAHHAWPNDYFTEANSVALRWHPYSYWLGRPQTGQYVNIENDGLRRTWHDGLTFKSPDRAPLRIFMFGGSAMWGYGAPDDDTIPSALARILAQEHVSARITNFGQFGYVSTQELILLFQQLRDGNVPDLVIFYDGFNDTASAFQNGVAGITENEVNRAREFNSLNSEIPEQRRALYRRAVTTFIRYLAIVRVASAVLYRICPSCQPSIRWHTADWINLAAPARPLRKDLPRTVLRSYLANVRLISETGQRLGFQSLFYWQPALYSRKHLSHYETRVEEDFVPGEKKFFLATYALARAAANDSKAPEDRRIGYLGDALPENMPCFLDSAHISGACNEVIAQRMASDINKLMLRTPLSRISHHP